MVSGVSEAANAIAVGRSFTGAEFVCCALATSAEKNNNERAEYFTVVSLNEW